MHPQGSNNSNLHTPEIEQIVQLVLERLRTQLPPRSTAPLSTASLSIAPAAVADSSPGPATPASALLQFEQPLLTTSDLRDRLQGVQQVMVSERCVVTPAVQDELRQRGIKLQRTGGSRPQGTRAASSSLAHCLIVVPTGSKLAGLARLLATAGASVQGEAENCQRTAELVRTHLQTTHGRCLWSASRPFGAMHAMAALGGSGLAVQLASFNELSAAVEQAQPNTLVVDDQRWSIAGLGRLAQHWNALQPTRSLVQ